jgi:hypothetical protein
MSALDEARAEVERKAETRADPALEPEEVEAVLAKHLRYATWVAFTEYEYGDVVVPSTQTGQKFRAIQGGTSGATTPFSGRVSSFAQVSDGEVVWEEDGADSKSPYDIRGAVYEALDLKVQRSVNQNQYINDGRAQASSYLYLNLVRERDKYKPVGVA